MGRTVPNRVVLSGMCSFGYAGTKLQGCAFKLILTWCRLRALVPLLKCDVVSVPGIENRGNGRLRVVHVKHIDVFRYRGLATRLCRGSGFNLVKDVLPVL